MQHVTPALRDAELEQHGAAEIAQRQLVVLVLPDALQPLVPRVPGRLAEEIVDDEELEIEIARQFEIEVPRPVMRPLDLHAAGRPSSN